MLFTIPLSSNQATLELAGGKGKNLSLLLQDDKLPVPDGFIVTTEAYKAFVKTNSLEDFIFKIVQEHDDSITENTNDKNYEKVSETIRKEFCNTPFPTKLRDDIVSSYESLGNDVAVAVRSSATAEDLPDLSFAGQQDTYLNIYTKEKLLSNVVNCFASLWTARAISYRSNAGINHSNVSLAVVVQVMVPSESSGVLFTANPLNDRRDQIVLEVVRGLGEALVSGLTDPDRYILNRNGDVLDRRVGSKAVSIRPKVGGGTEELNELGIINTSLTDEEVRELVQLCVKVEKIFDGVPQDIEWGHVDGKYFLLQSRPITTLFPLIQNVPPNPARLFYSFNYHQGLMQPFTPLGQDAIRMLISGAYRVFTGKRMKIDERKSLIATPTGRIFVNLTDVVQNTVFRKFITNFFKHVMKGISDALGNVLEEDQFQPIHGLSWSIRFNMMKNFIFAPARFLFTLAFPNTSRKVALNKIEAYLSKVHNQSLKAQNLNDWIDLLESSLSGFFGLLPYIVPRFAVGAFFFAMKHFASKNKDGETLTLSCLRSLPHNPTTEMDLFLWDVAQQIRKDDASFKFFQDHTPADLAQLYAKKQMPKAASMAIDSFIDIYGMRGLAEIDFGQPRWRENPTPLMEMLKNYLHITDEKYAPDFLFSSGVKEAERAIDQVGCLLGYPRLVRFLMTRVRAVFGLREVPKFTIIRIMGIIRLGFLNEATRLVSENVLESKEDIFYLYLEELRSLANSEPRDWKALVKSRRESMINDSKRKRLPLVLVSDGRVFYEGPSSLNSNDPNILSGEAVSPGSVEGRVRIVHDPMEANLKPGEILVCHGTDPAWTPLFLLSCALITEVGGMMTHGSVVAREYGIPAVVGISKITDVLKTGQRVRVDGSNGQVIILEEN